jgi:hypothetical protein
LNNLYHAHSHIEMWDTVFRSTILRGVDGDSDGPMLMYPEVCTKLGRNRPNTFAHVAKRKHKKRSRTRKPIRQPSIKRMIILSLIGMISLGTNGTEAFACIQRCQYKTKLAVSLTAPPSSWELDSDDSSSSEILKDCIEAFRCEYKSKIRSLEKEIESLHRHQKHRYKDVQQTDAIQQQCSQESGESDNCVEESESYKTEDEVALNALAVKIVELDESMNGIPKGPYDDASNNDIIGDIREYLRLERQRLDHLLQINQDLRRQTKQEERRLVERYITPLRTRERASSSNEGISDSDEDETLTTKRAVFAGYQASEEDRKLGSAHPHDEP